MNENPDIRSARMCAYCGEIKDKLTREHIFPDALDKEFRKDGTGTDEPYWIDRLEKKMVGGQPTVKDVCQDCNNNVLSQLDSYGLGLYKKYFHRIAEHDEEVELEYDYDLLLRWILKLSFNSARVNKADDLAHLRKLRWYILGRHKRPARLALYLTLIFGHDVDDSTKARAADMNTSISSHNAPDLLRIGRFAIQDPRWSALVSRTTILQSFFFSVFFVGEKQPASELIALMDMFSHYQPDARLLVPDRNRLRVKATLSSHDAIKTHIWRNMPYYTEKFLSKQQS